MKLEWDWSEVEWVGMDVQKYAETKQNEELPVSQSTDGRIYHWGCERWRTMGWHCRARMSSCPSACSEPVQWWACWMQHRWWLWRRLLPRSWSCARPGTRTRNPESRCSVSGGTLALTCSRSWRISLDPRQFQHGPLFDARKRFIHHRYIRPFVTAKGEAVRHTTIKMDKQGNKYFKCTNGRQFYKQDSKQTNKWTIFWRQERLRHDGYDKKINKMGCSKFNVSSALWRWHHSCNNVAEVVDGKTRVVMTYGLFVTKICLVLYNNQSILDVYFCVRMPWYWPIVNSNCNPLHIQVNFHSTFAFGFKASHVLFVCTLYFVFEMLYHCPKFMGLSWSPLWRKIKFKAK